MTTNTSRATRPSLDDPRVAIPGSSSWYEPAPTPQTERQAEFLTLREGEMFVNMGPQHPSTHGVLRVIIKVNGEKVDTKKTTQEKGPFTVRAEFGGTSIH